MNQEVKEKYNQDIPGKFQGDYEGKRWFSDEIQKANFIMTRDSIQGELKNLDYLSCLELGPGHGTWTKQLLEKNSQASYDLVDISASMLDLVKKRFVGCANIKYFESDFLNFGPDKKYDFFFSSRAIEYIDDKEKMTEKIAAFLSKDGKGLIVTKTPHYFRQKMLGKKPSAFHSKQILPQRLSQLLANNNFTILSISPVTFSWPLWHSAKMNRRLFKYWGKSKLNFISQFFCESYLISFKKK